MKFLVLYEEMASYFLNCLEYMASQGYEIQVIMKKVNPVAPFDFSKTHKNIVITERESMSQDELIQKIKQFDPDLTYLSGWIYKPYLKAIRSLRLKNVVIGFDNQYNGSLRQKFGALYFKRTLKPFIKAAFVPGQKQVEFAKRLGFGSNQIATNVYCCQTELYTSYNDQTNTTKRREFPKRFLFVGRYVPEKGIDLLWQSFIELQNEFPNPWELWCIGKGEITPIQHPKIKHLGFIQPSEFLPVIQQTGVFVLPSVFEPWGVVLHEYACAGYPMISTTSVGATEAFLEDTKNGFLIKDLTKDSLKGALKKIVSLTDAQLQEMSDHSVQLSKKITPQIWQKSLLKLVHEHA